MRELPSEFGKGNLDAKKFWMAPDGTFYGVKYEWSHPGWVSELFKFLKWASPADASDEMYKRGWVRILTGFEGQTYTLWYEHRHVPVSAKLKHKIRDLAIELRVMKMKDRYGNDEEFLPEHRTISKSVLKKLIKKIINEVSQKDLKHRHPHNPAFFDKNRSGISGFGGWDVDKLTLDNLMSLKRKTKDMIAWLQKHPNEKNNEWLKYEQEQYKMISLEIQNRIDYINKPMTENQTPEIKSKHFIVKFGEKELPGYAGKILYGDVWFANAVKVNADWNEKHKDEWVINRHTGAFQMGFPSIDVYFKTVPELLNYIEKWLQNSGNLREDLQQRHNQIGSQSQCTGTSHAPSNDYADVQMTRDQLNDPMLNGKLHEGEYKFDEFKWLSRMDGFGTPIDVRRGTVLLGVIVSQPDGYLISTILGPHGSRSYRQDPKKPFKTKEDAARALDMAWRILRSGETNFV